MKNIKELGLELIELEDRVLLVTQNEMISPDDLVFESKDRLYSVTESTYTNPKEYGVYKILASTVKLRKGLPLLVIEDEVESIADELSDAIHERWHVGDERSCAFIGAKKGYNKAREVFRFTEEDLRKAIDMARKFPANSSYFPLHTTDEIIQSLTKKELWIEVEEYDHSQNITDRCKFRPNVSQGKIKAIWK